MYVSANPSLLKPVNRLNLEILTFGYAGVDPDWFGNVVSPVYSRLYYITDGAFTIWTDQSEKMRLGKGHWYLIPSGYSFDYECGETMEHFYFHVKLCDFDGTDLLRNCAVPLCLTPEKAVDCDFFKKCLDSNRLTDGLLLRQAVFDVLISFIDTYQIPIDAQDYSYCIFKALVYIKQNLSMQLSIAEIAENIFVSKSTLTKHFQKELHMSVNEYICNTIMADAERLLMTSNISIHDLALKFGYTDQLYFSRRFKEKFGKSPREYRKQKRL
ncbi:MAG: helix-turn-helix transcriptional regulator [Ruminococcaceae bacterium]|nr:helix-turn-helix transcriptional regulator [Oscillospiraceae bacterium]